MTDQADGPLAELWTAVTFYRGPDKSPLPPDEGDLATWHGYVLVGSRDDASGYALSVGGAVMRVPPDLSPTLTFDDWDHLAAIDRQTPGAQW